MAHISPRFVESSARTGCPQLPCFLRPISSRKPPALRASQPSPTAPSIVSLVAPLNDDGGSLASESGSGAAAAGSACGEEPGGVAPDGPDGPGGPGFDAARSGVLEDEFDEFDV